MTQYKFTIIVPTKNRADTLYWTLKTCVEQQYENLDILVSDNFSTDNTKDVALGFKDARIKYINTGAAISMSGNWEFALSHVQEGYVTFLGDDDAFLPGAITGINKIVNETNCDAVNAACIEYNWPDHLNPLHKNKMFFIKNSIETNPDVHDILLKVLHCEMPYSTLPWLYKGFVSVALLRKIKEVSKLFFNSRNPDVYSAIAVANAIQKGKFYYSKTPFAINGASSHSNGASHSAKSKNAGAVEFNSDLNIPFHKDLITCTSFPVYVYESYLQVKDAGLLKAENAELIKLDEVLEKAMELAQYTDKSMHQKLQKAILEIGSKNNIDDHKMASIIKKYPNKNMLARFANKAKNRYFSNVMQINMDDYNVKNVYDAAYIADKIVKKEINPSSAKAIATIAGDIKTIFKSK